MVLAAVGKGDFILCQVTSNAYADPLASELQEDGGSEVDEAEELRQRCELRGAVIVAADLAPDAPDLLLTFEDRRILFLFHVHADHTATCSSARTWLASTHRNQPIRRASCAIRHAV